MCIPGNRPACKEKHAHGPDPPTSDTQGERADRRIDGFDASEGPFHAGERLVAAHRRRIVEGLRRQRGAYTQTPSTAASAAISTVLRVKTEGGIGDVKIEMLGHLV